MCEFCEDATVRVTLLERVLLVQRGENLLAVLRNAGENVPAVCGGHGKCKKCLVFVDGVEVLACNVTILHDISVRFVSDSEQYSIQSEFAFTSVSTESGFGIAVDIGTTTVVVSLVDLQADRLQASRAFMNRQRIFGGDVISRIKASCEGHADELRKLIVTDIVAKITELLVEKQLNSNQISSFTIAGNTTEMYLLLGYSCKSLGAFPFTPEFAWQEAYTFEEVFGNPLLTCPVTLVPWISAFVGGDITAGLLTANFAEPFVLLDMGTNGEMAVWNGKKLLCTSTAAGPAFEGGNISCGVGGVSGAIASVQFASGTLSFQTIDNEPPIGLCGSGVLDMCACLLEGGFADETGLLHDEFFDEGVVLTKNIAGSLISFTQKDIRELQLAKSAIRAGLEIILLESGLQYEDVKTVYLCGGFGQKMSLSSAVKIGILPQALREKTMLQGNSALAGSIALLKNPKRMSEATSLAREACEMNLSNHPKFNDYFMEYMMFEEVSL